MLHSISSSRESCWQRRFGKFVMHSPFFPYKCAAFYGGINSLSNISNIVRFIAKKHRYNKEIIQIQTSRMSVLGLYSAHCTVLNDFS